MFRESWKMPWFSKPPKQPSSTLDRDLVLGGLSSIALQNIFFETFEFIRTIVRKTMNMVNGKKQSPYNLVPENRVTSADRNDYYCGKHTEHLVLTANELYYVHPKTLHVYACKKFTKENDPNDKKFKLNPYMFSLLNAVENPNEKFRSNKHEMMCIFLLHMLLNDFYCLFKAKKENNIDDYHSLADCISKVMSSPSSGLQGFFIAFQNNPPSSVYNIKCSDVIQNFVSEFSFSERLDEDLNQLGTFWTPDTDIPQDGDLDLEIDVRNERDQKIKTVFVPQKDKTKDNEQWWYRGRIQYTFIRPNQQA